MGKTDNLNKHKTDNLLRMFPYLKQFKIHFLSLIFCFAITAVSTFAQPLVMRKITDDGFVQKDLNVIIYFALFFLLLCSLVYVFDLLQNRIFVGIHNKLADTMYNKAFSKLLRLPISYYGDSNSNEIIHKLSTDIGYLTMFAGPPLLASITSVLHIIGGLLGLSLIDWRLTILIAFMIPIKLVVVNKFSNLKSKSIQRVIESNRFLNFWLGDIINGIKEIKLWNLFRNKSLEFKTHHRETLKNYKKDSMLDQYNTLAELLIETFITCGIYIACGFYIVRNQFTIGSAFAFIAYSGYVIGPISVFLNLKYLFAKIHPSAKRFFDFIDLKEEQYKSERNILYDRTLSIKFSDICFSYEPGKPVLNNLNLTINAGEKIGIVGANGSGKTTLINLLLGFYIPLSGSITINGRVVQDIGVNNLRKICAVVSQDPYLFQTTVLKNINLVGDKDMDQVIVACHYSGTEEFIKSLPQGYDQQIGKNGTRLSGGERQKLALARAIVKQADIIILDEATSSCDLGSDIYIQKMMEENFRDKTVIFITHKYRELKNMDKVYELSGGKIKKQNYHMIMNI